MARAVIAAAGEFTTTARAAAPHLSRRAEGTVTRGMFGLSR
jgi:hypothetical protein